MATAGETTPVRAQSSMTPATEDNDDDSALDPGEQTQRPRDVALMQQRIDAWHPILDPVWVIVALFYLGVILVRVLLPGGCLMSAAAPAGLNCSLIAGLGRDGSPFFLSFVRGCSYTGTCW